MNPTTTTPRRGGRQPAPPDLVDTALDAASLLHDNQRWDAQEWPALHQVGHLFVRIAQDPGCPAVLRRLAVEGAERVQLLVDGDRAENVRNARAAARLRDLGGALEGVVPCTR